MGDDAAQLDELIAVMEERLPLWGFSQRQVDWLADRRREIVERSRPLSEVRSDLRAICTGMGSLVDQWIADEALRAERDRLTNELFRMVAG